MGLKERPVVLQSMQQEYDVELFAPSPEFKERLTAHGARRPQKHNFPLSHPMHPFCKVQTRFQLIKIVQLAHVF